MTCIYSTDYANAAVYPMNHARILHGGLWISGGTVSASDTATGFYADAPDGPETWQKWRPDTAPATWEHDFGAEVAIDCVGLLLRDIGTGTILVQHWDGAAWVTDATVDMTTIKTGATMVLFDPVLTEKMRLSLSDFATVAVCKFGEALEMPRPVYGSVTPPELNPIREYEQSVSNSGELLGRTETRQGTSVSITWQHIPRPWAVDQWQLFSDNAADGFFIAWNPLRSGAAEYAWATSSLTAEPMSVLDFHNLSLTASGYGND